MSILLIEELTLRESRRVCMAFQMARLSAVKTLAPKFDTSERVFRAFWRAGDGVSMG
jgi:hypothetical protein